MKNRPVIATFSVITLSFAIYSGVLFFSSNEPTATLGRASEPPVLRFDALVDTARVGTNIAVPIRADSVGELIDTITVSVTYDPEFLQALSITPQGLLGSTNTTTQSIDPVTHIATFTLHNEPGTEPEIVSGISGFVAFKTLKPGSTELRLLPTSNMALNNQPYPTLLGAPSSITVTLN